MKICEQCRQAYPDSANYCMACGRLLVPADEEQPQPGGKSGGNWNLFWLTLGGSLLLSWVLIAVFHLPVFILGAVLPLLWFSKNR